MQVVGKARNGPNQGQLAAFPADIGDMTVPVDVTGMSMRNDNVSVALRWSGPQRDAGNAQMLNLWACRLNL